MRLVKVEEGAASFMSTREGTEGRGVARRSKECEVGQGGRDSAIGTMAIGEG